MSQAKNNIIKHAQLDWSDQSEPFSTLFSDIYFNNNQGLNESQYVFFEGNSLAERWDNFPNNQFCIIETGFGTGLNFLNTAYRFLHFKETNEHANLKRLHFISFEKYPLNIEDLNKALSSFPQFKLLTNALLSQYPLPVIGCHRLSFNDGEILLDLWFGDINEQINNLSNDDANIHDLDQTEQADSIADAWFLDGFNPSTNPDMWQITLFKKMIQHSKPEATLATFTAAGFVRRGLIEAGFKMEKRKGYGKKREMLVGKREELNSSNNPQQTNDIAIIGGGIASLCSALSLAKRGNKVTIYCADKTLGEGASGNRQGALYPLLNQEHDALSQLFTNAYIYALNFYKTINHQFPFPHQFNGLIQLAYDESSSEKLQKIVTANLPKPLVRWINTHETNQLAGVDVDCNALFYASGGWLSPKQLLKSLHHKLMTYDNVDIHCDHHIASIKHSGSHWLLNRKINKPTSTEDEAKEFRHETLIIAAGFNTIKFEQCNAVPLSAARGQVSHIETTPQLSNLKRTLCHEGYITPSLEAVHCMGATFKRHDEDINYRSIEQTDNLNKLNKCITNKNWVKSITLHDQAHTAIRCTTRDHFPYVGALTDYNLLKKQYESNTLEGINSEALTNIYLLTGLGSRGLCTAPLLAEIIASVIHRESLPIDKHIYKKMQIPRQWFSYIKKNKPLKV